MDSLTRRKTIAVLAGLPPAEYLAYCDTEDQKKHWESMKSGYTYLNACFSAYFSGEANPAFELEDASFWAEVRDWYLAYYGVLQDGWLEIETVLGSDLSNYAKSPGEAFIRCLEDDCAAIFAICLQPYYSATPNEDRNWAALERKLATELHPSKQQALQKKFDAIAHRRLDPIANHLRWRNNFMSICEKSKSGSLRSRLRDYKRKQGDLDRLIARLNHPNQGRTGGTWVKGEYRPSG